jgi:hypothetical protein
MLKCSSEAPNVQRQQGTFIAALSGSVRDSCVMPGVDACDQAEVFSSASLKDAHNVASAMLQRLSLMEAAKSSAHHTIFGIAVDTPLLISALSFTVSGVASFFSTYGK